MKNLTILISLCSFLISAKAQFNETFVGTASDAKAEYAFGNEIDIFQNKMIVGAYLADQKGHDAGAAYVFSKSSYGWIQDQMLLPTDINELDLFGKSVSIHKNLILIGASSQSTNGAAYLYEFSSNSWTLKQKFTPSTTGRDAFFGHSVCVSDSILVIGAPGYSGAKTNAGQAYIYTKNGNSWGLDKKISASNPLMEDGFGFKVAVDGNTVAIGEKNEKYGSSVSLFEKVSGTWNQVKKMTGSPSSQMFGTDIQIIGNTMMIADQGANINTGAILVYEKISGAWGLSQTLSADSGEVNSNFAHRIDFSNGELVATFDGASVNKALVHFSKINGQWQEDLFIVPAPDADKKSFSDVAVSPGLVISSDAFATNFGRKSGAFYEFEPWPLEINQNSNSEETPHVYPNPSNGWVIIDHNKPQSLIQIFDLSGFIVLESFCQKKCLLNVSHLKNGIYILKSGKTTYKLLLEQ